MDTSYDETKGWIFSDDYHEWQDNHSSTSLRYGGLTIEFYGWYLGLYQIKAQDMGDTLSQWPEPIGIDDLEKLCQ